MQLVEQHRIDRHDPRWKAIDAATFASKNLYNAALYVMRQQFITNQYVFPYAELDVLLSPLEQYQALPRKVAQWVLKQVCAAWTSYQAACAEYRMHPQKFKGHPKLPKYVDKQGRNLLVYTDQAVSRDPKNAGWVVPSGVAIRVATKLTHDQIAQVRLVPKAHHFVVEVVYDRPVAPASGDPEIIASIDIGVNNLATITANKPGFVPLLVNGRPLKSLNQAYNKRRAKLQAALPPDTYTSRLLDAMTDHRTRSISYYLHAASRAIIDLLVQEGVGTLVIGRNIGWKQEVHLGKRNNQHFVFLPHARFIEMLQYKAQLVGITVLLVEESHTNKCSFLDLEPIGHHAQYLGKRVKRGMFVCANGRCINADVNGSYNILRKAFPSAFAQGIAHVKIHPKVLSLPDRRQDRSKQSRTLRATG